MLSLGAIALLGGLRSNAVEPPPRTGLYVQGAASLGYSGGHFEYSGQSLPTYTIDARSRPVRFEDSTSGGSIRIGGALGYGVIPGLALALEAQAWVVTGSIDLGYTKLSGLMFQSVGPLVDWYPATRGPVHLIAGGGLVWGRPLTAETSDVGAAENIVSLNDLRSLRGGYTEIGIGYGWRSASGVDVGPLLRLTGERLTSGHASMTAGGVEVSFGVTWF